MVVFGVVGFVLQRYGYPVAPIVLGLILGPMLETHFRRALIVSRGDYGIFLQRPIAAALLAVAAIYLLPPIVAWLWRRRRVVARRPRVSPWAPSRRAGKGCLPRLSAGALGVWHYRAMAPDLDGACLRRGRAPVERPPGSRLRELLGTPAWPRPGRGLARRPARSRSHGHGADAGRADHRQRHSARLVVRAGLAAVGHPLRQLSLSHVPRGDRATGRPEEVAVYWGIASRAFALDGSASSVRVLAVPRLGVAPVVRKDPKAVERARELVAGTTFEARTGPLGGMGSVFQMVEILSHDEDGEVRRDWSNGERRDPADLILEERALPVGAVASAYGHWSAEQGAMVAQGIGSVTPTVDVALGPPEAALDETSGAPATFRA